MDQSNLSIGASIRKRYDEIQTLLGLGLHEPALILALVMVAAAAERYRRHHTENGDKAPGDDRRWFVQYVQQCQCIPKIESREANGELISETAVILYKNLRNDVIHEATIDPDLFKRSLFSVSAEGGKQIFGIHIIRDLSEAIRLDPLGRREFLDQISKFENIVEFVGDETKEDVFKNFTNRFGLTAARMGILELIVTALRPEQLAKASYSEMRALFENQLLPNLHQCGLNSGALTGLRSAKTPILDSSNALTVPGHTIIQELASHYALRS